MTRPSFFQHRRQGGFALVLTLAAVVLLTILILTFLSRSLLNRQISNASSQQIQSALLARTSLNIIVGELREEMRHKSSLQTVSGVPAYFPTAVTDVVPSHAGVSTGAAAAVLKVSGATMDSASTLDLNSTEGTDIKSLNGRYILTNRWYDPTAGGPGLGSNGVVPKWVFLTRNNGAKGTDNLTIANAHTKTSDDYVVGRFAYTVYDLDGLLDANVAGYPSADATDAPYKTSSSYADLSVSALSVDGAKLTAWRNAATGASASTFSQWATGSTTAGASPALAAAQSGHQAVAQGDNAFVSRGDLVQAALNEKAGLLKNSLPYLTHFSRTMAGSSWGPFYDAANEGGTGDAYKTAATPPNNSTSVPTATNPLLPAIRFSNLPSPNTGTSPLVHYHDDGTQATPVIYIPQNGDPYLRQKFSLAKLAWLTWKGPAAGISTTAIQACFGLQWNSTSNSWSYIGSSGGAGPIETLAQAATENREPNFFELIKAGILTDSLGLSSSNVTYTAIRTQDASADAQALQIGANMIDQADTDSYPTCIVLGSTTVYGVENLPYINRLTFRPYRPPDGSTHNTFECWMQFDVWNPHYRANTVIEDKQQTGGGYPAKFRIIMTGGQVSANLMGGSPQPATSSDPPSTYYIDPNTTTPAAVGSSSDSTAPFVTFPPSDQWAAPETLLPTLGAVGANGFVTLSAQINPDGSHLALNPDGVALYLGSVVAPDAADTNQWNTDPFLYGFIPNYQVSPTFDLQYQSPTGWRTYEEWAGLGIIYQYGDTGSDFGNGTFAPFVGNDRQFFGYGTSDPRIMRFGITLRGPLSNQYGEIPCLGASYAGGTDENSITDSYFLTGTPFAPNGAAGGSGVDYYQFAFNDGDGSVGHPTYKDKDSVGRYGDGANAAGTDISFYKSGQPGGLNDPPVILDRPFRSVAELGYVTRDLPWKTLDFNTTHSADAGLLSLFSVSDEAPTIFASTQAPLVAGKINVNTAPAAVLQSIFSGAALNPEASSTPTGIDTTASAGLASAVTVSVASAPWTCEGDGVFQFASNTSANSTVNGLTRTLSDGTAASEKKAREAVMRSLGSVDQSRTWVLLIDVIAQSGLYTPNTTSLDQFTVRGESRYWLSIAIDRYTGKVVDEQLEIPSND